VASETGVPGFLFFAGMGILLLYKSIRLAQELFSETAFLIGMAVTAALAGMSATGIFNNTFRLETVLCELTILAALVIHYSCDVRQGASPDVATAAPA
jgi:hypothetical protein